MTRQHTLFPNVGLFGKYLKDATPEVRAATRSNIEEIAKFLEGQGCSVLIEQESAAGAGVLGRETAPLSKIGAKCSLGIVVGGDGTMLGVGRQLAHYGLPLIGINQGRLGFITDIPLGEYRTMLTAILAGDYESDERRLMHARVVRAGVTVYEALAMNDVVVNRGGTSGMVELRIEVNGAFVTTERADGLILTSPTGSSAYAMAAGGPLLHPATPCWALVPIAPHALSNRPIVLSDGGEVVIELVAGRDASANFDSQSLASLAHGDRVTVKRSPFAVRFLHPKGWTYFETVRNKLHWNER